MYEKEEMEVRNNEQGVLTLTYVKRKVEVKLDRHKLAKNQIVLMLYGRGDSVSID